MFTLRVWGNKACFTQPPLKVERVTYPVITPTAAQGIFDSIYRGDDMYWGIHRIYVLNPIRYMTIKTNEWREAIPKDRIQRNSEILYDVDYAIQAEIYPKDPAKFRDPSFYGKNANIFLRKSKLGAQWRQPYFGLQQFVAYWDLVPDEELPQIEERAKASGDADFGSMLCTFNYDSQEPREPVFYKAIMQNGIIEVPCYKGKYNVSKETVV